MQKDSLYGEVDQTPETQPRPGEEDAAPEAQGEDQDETSTFLVNKEVSPEAKPGDRFTVEVVRVHDSEMECRYVGEDEQGEPKGVGDGEPAQEPVASPDDRKGSLYE